ncbi:MAG: transcriptional regulator [Planctomycetes bacterium]|nr:transcriptional regulator [Planctomycetota bacterium]
MKIAFISGLLGLLALPGSLFADPSLAAQARTVLKTHCQRCHNGEGSAGGNFDVMNEQTLLAELQGEKPVVVPGKLDESKLWQRAGVKKNMPPKDIQNRPSDADLEIIKKWIEAGASTYPRVEVVADAKAEPKAEAARRYVSPKAMLTAVRDHLRDVDQQDRPYIRYFTIMQLYNNARVPDDDLGSYRAALSKAINSLSWKPRIAVPKAIDKDQTVFAVDLRDYDWDRDHLWTAIMAAYPYGVSYSEHADRDLQKLDEDVRTLTDCSIPIIRADWFIATATRPPLYHVLLRIPKNAVELEKKLDVDIPLNFGRDRLDRAGFIKSGVSEQNRLIERHDASYGAYWKSYDFKKNNAGNNDLIRFPLGPEFKGNKYAAQAFQHDGGEIVFSLPNGLNGYMLVDAKDGRIDEGPIDVVSDSQKTSGSNLIVNGLSCMACHKYGVVKPPADAIRAGNSVFGDAKRKVERLYPEAKKMVELIQDDEDRFLKACEKAMKPFIAKSIKDLPAEPIGEIARLYGLQELDAATAACELGLDKPEQFKTMIQGNKKLRELGLGVLMAERGVIKRNEWERGANSLMQRVARELDLGKPVHVLGAKE